MRYHRSFVVEAPLERVEEFHRSPASFRALAPPGVPLVLERAPELLVPGEELAFKLWLGPVPVRWVAALEALPEGSVADEGAGETVAGFVDRQIEGPFSAWVHRHLFRALGPERTEIDDSIEARMARHPLRGPVGLAMWAGLPVLFRYRAWRTRRELAAT